MDQSLEKWIGDADALVHHANFRIVQAVLEYDHITARLADYYTALVGELFSGCHRPAYWSQDVIGIFEPADDRRNEARA